MSAATSQAKRSTLCAIAFLSGAIGFATLAALAIGVTSSSLSPLSLSRVALRSGDRLIDLDEDAYGVVSVAGLAECRRALTGRRIQGRYGRILLLADRRAEWQLA